MGWRGEVAKGGLRVRTEGEGKGELEGMRKGGGMG